MTRRALGPLRFRPERGEAWIGGCLLELAPKPYALLLALAQAHPAPVYSVALERLLWPEGPPASDPLRMHVRRLRAALRGAPARVVAVYGVGYRLELGPRVEPGRDG